MAKHRLLKASYFYTALVDDLYTRRPELKAASYAEQWQALMDLNFAWSDHYKRTLEATGDYEVEEIITNVPWLQKAWARENGVSYPSQHWRSAILHKQIEAFRPNLLFLHDIFSTTPEQRRQLRKDVPEIQLVFGWDGTAINSAARYAGYDLILSCLQSVVEHYRQAGFHAEHLPFAFYPPILDKLDRRPPRYELTFAGTMLAGNAWHRERIELLYRLSKEVDVNFWITPVPRNKLIPIKPFQFKNSQNPNELRKLWRLGKLSKGSVFGLDFFQLMADSRIVINQHINIAGNEVANSRMFEATGVGTCLLTDWKDNLSDFFEPEKEVAAYRSVEECVEKAKYLLAHEDERQAIAQAGQARTLKDHSFQARMERLRDILEGLL